MSGEVRKENLFARIEKLRTISYMLQAYGFENFADFYELSREGEEEETFFFNPLPILYLFGVLFTYSKEKSFMKPFVLKNRSRGRDQKLERSLEALIDNFSATFKFLTTLMKQYNKRLPIKSRVCLSFNVKEGEAMDLETPLPSSLRKRHQKQRGFDEEELDDLERQNEEKILKKLNKHFLRFYQKNSDIIGVDFDATDGNVAKIEFAVDGEFSYEFQKRPKDLSKHGKPMLSRYGTDERVGNHVWGGKGKKIRFYSLLLPLEGSEFFYLYVLPKSSKMNISSFLSQLFEEVLNKRQNFVVEIMKEQKIMKLNRIRVPKMNEEIELDFTGYLKKKEINANRLFNLLKSSFIPLTRITSGTGLVIEEKGKNIKMESDPPENEGGNDGKGKKGGKGKKKKKKRKGREVFDRFVCDRDFALFVVNTNYNLILSIGLCTMTPQVVLGEEEEEEEEVVVEEQSPNV